MALLSTVYCTEAEMIRFLSQNALDDFGDNDADGTADADVVNDCINQATEEIDMYLTERYTQSGLSGSTLVNRWCVVMASRFLCQRRGNVVPFSIEDEWERLTDPAVGKLVLIAKDQLQLPGVALRADLSPSFSNLTVDRRNRRSTIRRTPTNSSSSATALSRDDVRELPGQWD